MHELRKTFVTSSGLRVAYIARYSMDGKTLRWSGTAHVDGDWKQIPGGVFLDVAPGFEETAVTGAIEAFVDVRMGGMPW